MPHTLHKSEWEIYLFYFAIIDLLFLPYVPFVATTFSQIFIVIWFLTTKNKLFENKELNALKIFIFFVVLGTIMSLLFVPHLDFFSEVIVENVKRAVQLIFLLLYYFFFYHISLKYNIRIKNILIAFLIYVFLWGLLYYSNFPVYIQFKQLFNPYDSFIKFTEQTDQFYRYSFIWTDPNNITYTVVGILIYLLINLKVKFATGLFSLITIFLINILSMSSGGWLSLLLFGTLPLLIWFRKELAHFSMLKTIFFFIVLFTILFYGNSLLTTILNDELFITSNERFEDNTGDSRLDIWRRVIEGKLDVLPVYLLFGTGSQIFHQNKLISPHNGHLFLIFAYGLGGYLSFIYIFFRKLTAIPWIKYFYILPFIFGFTVNIMFGEAKLTGLFLLLLAQNRVFDKDYINYKSSS